MTEFNHDEWVKTMVDSGQMAPEGQESLTPSGDEPQPDFADESVRSGNEETASGVEVKYLGHGAYEAEGVEVKRNGQTVSVDEGKAATLTGLQDDEGNVLFERV